MRLPDGDPDHGLQTGEGNGEDLEAAEGLQTDPAGPAGNQFCGWGNEESGLTIGGEDGYAPVRSTRIDHISTISR